MLSHVVCYCIAVTNQKGGVGKTVITANVGAALAESGRRVLLVDLDPQGHLTAGLGLREIPVDAEIPTLAGALMDRKAPAPQPIERTENLWVVPNCMDLFQAENLLPAQPGREFRLSRVIPKLGEYDYILIDCPPNLSVLTDNAIVAAKRVLVPVQPEDSSMRALDLLLGQLASLRDNLEIEVNVLGFVTNFVDETKVSLRVLAEIEQLPPPKLGRIRRRTVIREAWGRGMSVLELAPHAPVSHDFRKIATALRIQCEDHRQ
jgi:chromosome partitioning protein